MELLNNPPTPTPCSKLSGESPLRTRSLGSRSSDKPPPPAAATPTPPAQRLHSFASAMFRFLWGARHGGLQDPEKTVRRRERMGALAR